MRRRASRDRRQGVGDGAPVFVIAEIGINHNGSLELAKRLIDGAVLAGGDAVKFQKRTPELCVPARPVEHRARHALGAHDVHRLPPQDRVRRRASTPRSIATAASGGIHWFASCWDEESVDFIERSTPPCYKAASASLTDIPLLRKMKATGRPLILSTGMSTMEEIAAAVDAVGRDNLLDRALDVDLPVPARAAEPAHDPHAARRSTPSARSATPATRPASRRPGPRSRWARPSSSGTSRSTARCGAPTRRPRSRSAACCGWCANIRDIERSLGDGVKRVYESELAARKKLRRVVERAGDAPTQLTPRERTSTADPVATWRSCCRRSLIVGRRRWS